MTTALTLATQLEKALVDYKETVAAVKVTDALGDATEAFQAGVLKALLEIFAQQLEGAK